jgi:hypothetical protein
MVPLVPAIAFDMQRKGHPGRFDCRVWYADLLDFVVGSRCADLDGWRSIPDREIRHGFNQQRRFASTTEIVRLGPGEQLSAMTAWLGRWSSSS